MTASPTLQESGSQSGPFIVTTKRLTPDGLGVTRPNERRVVSTAREACMCVTVDHFNEALVAGNYPELREQYNALLAPWLPGDGPRVFGPLPDGAVIEIDQGGAP